MSLCTSAIATGGKVTMDSGRATGLIVTPDGPTDCRFGAVANCCELDEILGFGIGVVRSSAHDTCLNRFPVETFDISRRLDSPPPICPSASSDGRLKLGLKGVESGTGICPITCGIEFKLDGFSVFLIVLGSTILFTAFVSKLCASSTGVAMLKSSFKTLFEPSTSDSYLFSSILTRGSV